MNTAPAHIARDTYTGRWTLRGDNLPSRRFTARKLASLGKVGEVLVLWECAGSMPGGERLYVRTSFVPQADGSLVGYDADGARKVIHPAERVLRVRTK
jgi:hypothetical protein